MEQFQPRSSGVVRPDALSLGAAPQPPGTSSVTRDLLRHALPAGDFRNVEADLIQIGPGADPPSHRHDVAVLAYVLEAVVENQLDGGPVRTYRPGESYWEAPGTVHTASRNPGKTVPTRLLVVFIGEEGKRTTVPLK